MKLHSNIGFTVGTSASLFNQALLEIAQSDSTDGVVASALQSAIKAVGLLTFTSQPN